MRSLCSRGDRMRSERWSGVGKPLVHGDDRIERVVHRQVHHGQSALPLEGQKLVFSDGNIVCHCIPADDHTGCHVIGAGEGFAPHRVRNRVA